ncbi:aldo-keto reductase family 1 member B1-like isoform X1 [Tribolium madens]|uniref:aldo-keto reductase family 1 member B1-like isoform X1 n=1 Tax=Tribolium madens TaxID=41895 RepID=UPI001CF754FA|nr:aldo-keto reductase family 1 member B1-like isoform X1 [Tribolium madens]
MIEGMSLQVPTIKLKNGETLPALGLGTWKSKPKDVGQAIKDAIDIGYRLFDCAYIYKNEKEIGEAIREKIKEGVIQRDSIYIVNKLWSTYHRPDLVEPALDKSLANMGLNYIDLYLIHWPMGLKEDGSEYPINKDAKLIFSNVDYVDTWKAMEHLCKKGKVKSIGLSNFNRKQVERVIKYAKIFPVIVQIECHPYLTQIRMSEFLQSKGIILMAYSPLGSRDRPWAKPGDKVLLNEPKMHKIAVKYNKTVAQILLRYHIQRGHVVIPKSINKTRLQENFNIFDFELSNEEIKAINTLDCNVRFCPYKEASEHTYYPFKRSDE